MTFPLIKSHGATPLLEAISDRIHRQSLERRPHLIPLIEALSALVQLTSIDPGNCSTLKKCLVALQPNSLNQEDQKTVQLFIDVIVSKKREDSPRYPYLIESLATFSPEDRPPLPSVLLCSMELIALTGLTSPEMGTWSFWLRGLYPYRDFADLDPAIAEPFETMLVLHTPNFPLRSLGLLSEGTQSIQSIASTQEDEELRFIQAQKRCLDQTGCERLQAFLKANSSQFQSNAQSCQALLNALLAERSLVDQLQEMFVDIKNALEIEQKDLANVDQILAQMWQSNDELWHQSRELENAETGEEFGLILRTYQRLSEIQAPYFTDDPRLHRPQHRAKVMKRCLEKAVALKADLVEVAKTRADDIRCPLMGQLAQKLARYVDSARCKLLSAIYSDTICDIFTSCKKSLLLEILDSNLIDLCPALVASLHYLDREISTNRALTICSQILKLYEVIKPAQKELYAHSLAEQRKLIDSARPRRKLMGTCRLIFDLPNHSRGSLLPQELFCQNDKKPIQPIAVEVKGDGKLTTPAVAFKPAEETTTVELKKSVEKSSLIKDSLIKAETALGKSFPFPYHQRVSRWLKATTPLDSDLFPEYANCDLIYQQKMIEQHRFALMADRFWDSGIAIDGAKLPHKPRHRRFILPAELNVEKRFQRGVIIWSVNELGICYHRFFHPKTGQEVFETIVCKTFRDADFPELIKSQQSCLNPSMGHKWQQEGQVEFDPLLRVATLRDHATKAVLKIFLVQEDNRKISID